MGIRIPYVRMKKKKLRKGLSVLLKKGKVIHMGTEGKMFFQTFYFT